MIRDEKLHRKPRNKKKTCDWNGNFMKISKFRHKGKPIKSKNPTISSCGLPKEPAKTKMDNSKTS